MQDLEKVGSAVVLLLLLRFLLERQGREGADWVEKRLYCRPEKRLCCCCLGRWELVVGSVFLMLWSLLLT